MKTPSNIISLITQKIREAEHPDKIVLFGSFARGEALEDSDIDILVIKKTTLPRHKRARNIRKSLRGIKHPLDITVYTPEEVERNERCSVVPNMECFT